VQLRKIMEPGEVVQLDGALPLSVVLGRADEVDVSVRGQRLDVMSMSKANVARFEVK
jgi:cytoskeleton protein RodZ